MADTTHQGNWYVLVSGLTLVTSPITVASGLSIRNLDFPLSVFDLAAAGAVGLREWAVLEPFAKDCHCEIESAADAAILPGYDALNRAWLLSALLTLRGFGRHLCLACSSYSWNLIAGHVERSKEVFHQQVAREGLEAAIYTPNRDLPPFKGNLLDYHLKWLIEKDCRDDPLSQEDLLWIQQHFNSFNALASESDKFRFALEAAIEWRYTKDARVAIARLWSGIEAIFGVSSELVYRLSLLAASLLAPRGPLRKEKFESVKKLYGIRSKAVHGEPLPDNVLLQAMSDSHQLLRDLLCHIVAKGRPLTNEDLDRAVFD